MINSKSPIIKYIGYGIISLFVAIIVISFGMPAVLPELTQDRNTVASINGEKIHINDFRRFRDSRSRGETDDKNIDKLLTEYIQVRLILQKAKEMNFEVTDDRVARDITNIQYFKNPETGKFNPELFNRYLENTYQTLDKFYGYRKNDFIQQDFMQYIYMGVAAPDSESSVDFKCDKSKIQIKYAFISDSDLRNKFVDKMIVTDEEVTAEMKKNKKELKDPKTDKVRIQKKLEDRKFNKAKSAMITEVNKVALQGGAFDQAAYIIGGKIAMSNQFKIGGPVTEDGQNGKPLTTLSNSNIFIENCLALPLGTSSRIIESATGLYVFTPILKEIPQVEPTKEDLKSFSQMNKYQSFNGITNNIITKYYEKSKIEKKLKNN